MVDNDVAVINHGIRDSLQTDMCHLTEGLSMFKEFLST